MSLRYFAIACSVFALGCPELSRQGSDSPDDAGAHRVELAIPVRGRVRPYLMLVVDKSGSMNDSASAESTTTKWDDLVAAFADPSSGFLTTSRDQLHFGLTLFPSSMACDPGRIVVPLSTYRHNADQVVSRLASTVPEGGTPTSLSLQVAATDPRLVDAEPEHPRFVMLLTDGVPNCNPSPENQARCDICNADPSTCFDLSQNGCAPTFGTDPIEPCAIWEEASKGSACLDETGLVETIAGLRRSGIFTFVIGFGDALGTEGERTLNAAAEAGGAARDGVTKYYKASAGIELRSALDMIAESMYLPCWLRLDPPPANEDVAVALYDFGTATLTLLTKGVDWAFRQSSGLEEIELRGSTCDLLNTTEPNRFELRLSYVAKQ